MGKKRKDWCPGLISRILPRSQAANSLQGGEGQKGGKRGRYLGKKGYWVEDAGEYDRNLVSTRGKVRSHHYFHIPWRPERKSK